MLQVVLASVVSAGLIALAIALIGNEFRMRWTQVLAALEMRDTAVSLDPIPPLARRPETVTRRPAPMRRAPASPLRLAA